MSTHDDHDEPGLTPEERALARRLARLGPHGEPSAALDARILAAAHAAAAPESGRPHRDAKRRKVARWPTVFGFAASLALACGIAWQLRPVPEAPGAAQDKAAAEEPLAEYAPPPPAPSMDMRKLPPKELKVPEPPPPAQAAQPPRRAAIRPATPADAQEKPQAFDMPVEPFVVDEAIHPAPAAAPQAARESAAAAADMAAPPAPAAAKAAAANARQRVESLERQRADAEPAFAEPDEEVVPPATTDDPMVRDAWLRRIRELLQAGDEEAARASVQAFRERYPRESLPDDLRALEE